MCNEVWQSNHFLGSSLTPKRKGIVHDIGRNVIFIFGLEISTISPKGGLVEGKVWVLLDDLSFGDNQCNFYV